MTWVHFVCRIFPKSAKQFDSAPFPSNGSQKQSFYDQTLNLVQETNTTSKPFSWNLGDLDAFESLITNFLGR